ncbi:MAG: bifunctional methionine sulfoxide reductase B/A protein [Candidatus Cloacimonetes bacterium]|nr:bifunctional methionine sulfoxide reductase B/A protein [Candidatus Cloacimonadota bacterium]MBL7149222.1 bifunctional methionine sulfoxide reductase B/A protein [Candidatus Cloacimonadota bacterium]
MIKLMILALLLTGVVIMNAEEKYRELNDLEKYVIEQKGTERPFTGIYTDHFEEGLYKCKKCGGPLFKSDNKFHSSCGWPSFDDAIEGKVKEQTDADGRRTEILCANCNAHLGHVFLGEGLTDKNVRHCVNSVSLQFQQEEAKYEKAYFAGGCFWGVEYHFQKLEGVISTSVGYMGGNLKNPVYYDVTTGTTGHAETAKIVYDPSKISYEELTKLFFEIHDPTQINRQGPDIGHQYRSAVYYTSDEQKETAKKLIEILEEKGYDVATEVESANKFYPAEKYHQDYYEKKGSLPYCHIYTKRFD